MAFKAWMNLAITVGATLVGCGASAQNAPAAAVQTGVRHEVWHVDGVDYPLTLFVPESAKSSAVPVVIVFHGAGGTGEKAFHRLEIDTFAPEKGFIVIAPSGRDNKWRARDEPDEQADFDLFRDLLDMVPKLGGDPKRVYVIGFSNGGRMAQVIGARFGDRIAAICAGGASIGGLGNDLAYHEVPKPKRPIPALLFHGMVDKVSAYDMSHYEVSSPDSLGWWARQDGIAGPMKHDELAGGDILRDIYEGTDGLQVVLLSYKKLAHEWPNVVDADTGMKFNELMWEFLSKYSLK